MSTFSPTGSASPEVSLNDSNPSSFVVTEVAFDATPNTTFTHVIASTTKRFSLKVKECKRVDISNVDGTDWWKIPAGSFFDSGPINLSGTLTIYMTAPSTGGTVEIVEWRE